MAELHVITVQWNRVLSKCPLDIDGCGDRPPSDTLKRFVQADTAPITTALGTLTIEQVVNDLWILMVQVTDSSGNEVPVDQYTVNFDKAFHHAKYQCWCTDLSELPYYDREEVLKAPRIVQLADGSQIKCV
jgi:hypothetical protein